MPLTSGNHHLRSEEAGTMLVEVLVARARGAAAAWQEANDLVRGHRVQVNGNVCADPARLMKAGDVVKVLPHAKAPQARLADVRLVHADEHVVVIDKPPAVTTMREPGEGGSRPGGNRRGQATLEEMVASLLSRSAAGGKKGRRPRRGPASGRARPAGVIPVHRLDRDTSGLMVFARTAAAEKGLLAQFKAHRARRSYLAVVHGHPRAMTITSHLLRDRGDGVRGSAEIWGGDPAGGQRAVTHVEPLERIGEYAVVRCTLETGRTHQIRIHLSEAGHMLCGEKQYTRRRDGTKVRDGSGAPRQALHADRLDLDHPVDGRPLRFRTGWPPDLHQWLLHLRAGSGGAGGRAVNMPPP